MIVILSGCPVADRTWPRKRFYQERKLVAAEVERVGTEAALEGRL